MKAGILTAQWISEPHIPPGMPSMQYKMLFHLKLTKLYIPTLKKWVVPKDLLLVQI